MRVTKEELNNYGLLDALPEQLKNLGGKDYFVFYYSVLEEQSKLYVHSFETVRDVNISLYRNLSQISAKAKKSLNIGYFSSSFETRDGIFYQFLRTYNDVRKVKEFYSYAVEQDKIVDLNVSTSSVSQINTSQDFSRAISYFCNGRLQPIMQVYDMVNEAMKNKLSKTLYGTCLKKVVNLVVYDGGVLPELGGTLRFMVIGEKAKLTEEQQKRLNEAKFLVRSMIPIDKVYALTGWALSTNDGKWRTNIADNEASINQSNLYPFQGKDLYVPTGQKIEDVLPVLANPERAVSQLYKGRLIEVFNHPTLYNYYPRLALMPIVYFFGENSQQQDFYFSPDERGGFILINGSIQSGDSLSILLHEIQHYIQNQEGFATGGNMFLAKFVASVGSNSVRKIFACINRMERYFREYLYDDDSRVQLMEVIKADMPKNPSARSIKSKILEMCSKLDEYQFRYKTLNFYLVIYIAENQDFSGSDVLSFVESKIPHERVVSELFQNVSEGYDESKNYREKLLLEGYRDGDIGKILFKGYENLYGEMESRSVQASRFVESEFKNYFYLTKWESTPIQQLTVIDGVEEIIDCTNIKAALETKDGEYVLHFKKDMSSLPFIHELGHIVHDCLNQLQYKAQIEKEYENDLYYNDIDEWFVDKFIAYIKGKIQDDGLQKDLRLELGNPNEKISKMLDEFFAEQNKIKKESIAEAKPKQEEQPIGEAEAKNVDNNPKEIIKKLKERKSDKAIHAEIFQKNGYNVFIYDNNKVLIDKTFKTHEEAKKYLNDWASQNGKENQLKYEYGTITDIAKLPYRQEITGNIPKDFIEPEDTSRLRFLQTILSLDVETKSNLEFKIFDFLKTYTIEQDKIDSLLTIIMPILENSISVKNFWNKPSEVRKLEGMLEDEMTFSKIKGISDESGFLARGIIQIAQYKDLDENFDVVMEETSIPEPIPAIVKLSTVQEIRKAVDEGKEVYAGSEFYKVVKGKNGQYLIKASNGYTVGLSGQEGTQYENKLNGSDFFYKNQVVDENVEAYVENAL